MSHKNKLGPCGFPLREIIAIADRFGAQAAAFGVTDPDCLNSFCLNLGKRLTAEHLRLEVAHDLPPYEHRLARVGRTAFKKFAKAELLPACADLGPHSGPMPDDARMYEAAQKFLDSFGNMHTVLGVSVSETLDLLGWIHCVLCMRMFFEDHPHRAAQFLPKPVPKRAGRQQQRL